MECKKKENEKQIYLEKQQQVLFYPQRIMAFYELVEKDRNTERTRTEPRPKLESLILRRQREHHWLLQNNHLATANEWFCI